MRAGALSLWWRSPIISSVSSFIACLTSCLSAATSSTGTRFRRRRLARYHPLEQGMVCFLNLDHITPSSPLRNSADVENFPRRLSDSSKEQSRTIKCAGVLLIPGRNERTGKKIVALLEVLRFRSGFRAQLVGHFFTASIQ